MNDLQLRYPIGVFKTPTTYDENKRKAYINTLITFPYQVESIVCSYSIDQLKTPYRPGGWTIAQVVHHCADSHVQAFSRFKWALTEDCPVIKPYEEQLWAELTDSKSLQLAPAIDTLKGVHGRWVNLLNGMQEADFTKTFYHPGAQKQYSLDESLALYDWHSRHHLAHIQLVEDTPSSQTTAINYHGRRFKSVANVQSGEVDGETIFEYYQIGQTLKANYKGGQILEGQMLGTVKKDGALHFHYQHLNTQGVLRCGTCQSIPEVLENGKIRLHETWHWLDGEREHGVSIVEEM
jgi:hypothetical protein